MRQFTLPKSERLYLRESIGELFANGRSFSVFPYRVVYLARTKATPEQESAHGESNMAAENKKQSSCAIMTVAPKKRFKHAVDRNRVKRLTREAYRQQKLPLLEAVRVADIKLEVAFLYVDNHFLTFDETYRIIGRSIAKLIKAVNTYKAELEETTSSTTSNTDNLEA